MKKHAPATLRNRDVILEVLRTQFPASGTVLEIAAGSGEHAVFLAQNLPNLDWQATDPAPDALESISAYREDARLPNLKAPLELDATTPNWPIAQAAAIVCINMVHISPWMATEGAFAGAARILSRPDAPLLFYGPYFEHDVEPAPSNVQFDAGLRERNPDWGIRRAEDMDRLASEHGFARSARYEMPANNLTLVYR
ncbi:MAG: DUF938 domain-containing protein, partial [Pseudomonadota bacterium]